MTYNDIRELLDTLVEEVKEICEELDKGLQELIPKDDPGKRRSLYPELGDILENISGGSYCVTGVSLDNDGPRSWHL